MSKTQGQVTVNLSAVQHNYKLLQQLVGQNVRVSGVVKANSYGVGALPVAKALAAECCNEFFVANLAEAIELRSRNLSCGIYTLNGFHAYDADLYVEHNIIPVIDSLESLLSYQIAAKDRSTILPVVIHVNTGMTRMGMSLDDVKTVAQDPKFLDYLDLILVMSHLACADDIGHEKNAQQLQIFQEISALFPEAAKSFANSSGVFLGSDYHFDMVRPGMAVYGLNPTPYSSQNPMQRVLDVHVSMIGCQVMKTGETLGYGATFTAQRTTRIAVIGAGYADGIFRSLSNKGAFYYKGQQCPIVGRVSMDMTCVDITDLDELPKIGSMFEYIGKHQSPADIGAIAGSFDYEVITKLGRRFHYKYVTI